jgi:hypothetical protein
MPLTKDFRETVRERLQRDPKARRALFAEAIECLLAGDVQVGKAVLRDYINATVGFKELSEHTHKPTKSLMKMLGPKGNPQASNLFEVIAYLQKAEGIELEIRR